MDIDKCLVKKYLGQAENSNDFDDFIDEIFCELKSFCLPKKLCIISDCTKENGYYNIADLGITLVSEDINQMFFECNKIATLVVTLGLEVDKKINYYTKASTSKAAIMDAVASVYVESVLDELEAEVRLQFEGKFATMRFSPGYGDLDLSLQKQLIEATQSDKYLGINVNDNFLMTPMKSITAFIGFSDKPQLQSNICVTCQQKENCRVKCNRAKNC